MILKLFYFLAITVKFSGSYCSLVVPIIFSSNSSMVVHKARILQIYIYIYIYIYVADTWLHAVFTAFAARWKRCHY